MLRGQKVVFFCGGVGVLGWVFVWGGLAVVDSVVVSFCLISKRIARFAMNVMIGGETLVLYTGSTYPGACMFVCMHMHSRMMGHFFVHQQYLYIFRVHARISETHMSLLLLSPRQLRTSPPRMALPMFLWQRLDDTRWFICMCGDSFR